jgi:hypothetical protein
LADIDEAVVAEVILCMKSLVEIKLFSTQIIQELVRDVSPLLLHPSYCIRTASSQVKKYLS